MFNRSILGTEATGQDTIHLVEEKREEIDDNPDNTEEEPRFQEEMKLRQQEVEAESFRLFTEEEAYNQRLKSIALVLGASGGWFVEEEEEE
ncbi:unnamed protein product [Strongylus vulgaris]|uniref:Uncharacterized protein n=1 Tax=Strongylus vulgaris TaxID=40348 RepID=A0A3P7LAF5_STRVU|nr:unnamed protein product [Strongylus vulgaris]